MCLRFDGQASAWIADSPLDIQPGEWEIIGSQRRPGYTIFHCISRANAREGKPLVYRLVHVKAPVRAK